MGYGGQRAAEQPQRLTRHVPGKTPSRDRDPPAFIKPSPNSDAVPVLPLAKETPYKSRTTDLLKFREGKLDDRRGAVITDLMNTVPEVDLDWFFENLLPPLPKGIDIAIVVEHLRKSGVITGEGWAGFARDPKAERRHEDIVFAQLGPLFLAILDAVKDLQPTLCQTFTLLFQPTRSPLSERGRSTKPDNCWVSMEDAESIKKDISRFYTWYTIAGPAEDKRLAEGSREQRNKNIAQIIYNLQQIMSLDPCRRFTFGTTMQDRHMRVWFACRGFVLTTQPCDFQDFGWDSTITCINPEFSAADPRKRRVYKIEVRDDEGELKSFKTISILADYAADSAVSRATRVWLVEDEQGLRYVLKDVWLDMDRLPEHEIRSQMLDDVLKVCGAEDHTRLQRHLLTPHICGKVFVDGIVDTTDGMMRNEVLQLSQTSVFTLKLDPIANLLRQSCDPASASAATSLSNQKSQTNPLTAQFQRTLMLRHKYHYRIVFTEHGHTLFDEKSLLNVYIILTDLFTALQTIHRSGWVHRDISCGNVYSYDQDHPRGILGDLEYARRCDATESHQLRTGTLDFMASEVISQSWDHLPIPPEDDDDNEDLQPAPFAYNPLHDLESCWWLLVYILLHNEDVSSVLTDPACISRRQNLMTSLFTRRPDTTWRGKFMRNYKAITVQETGLSPSLVPVVRTISLMANRLIRAFAMAEEPYTSIIIQDTFLKEKVYDKILPLINQDSPTRAQIQDIQLRPISNLPIGEKRKAEEKEDKEGPEDDQGPKFKKSRTHTSSSQKIISGGLF